MNGQKSKVNLNVAGNTLPFLVHGDYEPLYRVAAEMINKRMASLQNQYGHKAKAEELQGIIAVEALVDALKAQENYETLQREVNLEIDKIAAKVL